MKVALITGASGFLGTALTQAMTEQGYFVYAITRRGRAEQFNQRNIKVISDLDEIKKENIQNGAVLIHLAWEGITNSMYKDVNVQRKSIDYSIEIMNLAIELECKQFVFAGTNQFYLKDTNKVDGEEGFCSIYGAFKLATKEICRTLAFNRLQYNTVLFTNVYGVGDRSNRTTNLFIKKLLKGEALDLIDGDIKYDWTYIDDAIKGIIAVVEAGKNNMDYYVGSRNLLTFKEIIVRLRDILNPSVDLNFGKYKDSSYTDYSLIDLDALYNDTGFECTADFEESIKKTANWLISEEREE